MIEYEAKLIGKKMWILSKIKKKLKQCFSYAKFIVESDSEGFKVSKLFIF